MAVIALILVIILIILGIVFFFFPSAATLVEVRGTNFIVVQGVSSGGTGATGVTGMGVTGGTFANEDLTTGANYLYISNTLTGSLNVNIQPSNNNFVGLTIGVKNSTTLSSTAGTITLVGAGGVVLNPGGLDLLVPPGDFAWLVCTSTNPQTFMRLLSVT
jgi:hypothetical protein